MENFFDVMMEQEVKKILQESECKLRPGQRISKKHRRRNERIQQSLCELKQILLNCDPELLTVRRNGPRPGKLEELDILEMTVDYSKQLNNRLNQLPVPNSDSSSGTSYFEESGATPNSSLSHEGIPTFQRITPEEIQICEADSTSINEEFIGNSINKPQINSRSMDKPIAAWRFH